MKYGRRAGEGRGQDWDRAVGERGCVLRLHSHNVVTCCYLAARGSGVHCWTHDELSGFRSVTIEGRVLQAKGPSPAMNQRFPHQHNGTPSQTTAGGPTAVTGNSQNKNLINDNSHAFFSNHREQPLFSFPPFPSSSPHTYTQQV